MDSPKLVVQLGPGRDRTSRISWLAADPRGGNDFVGKELSYLIFSVSCEKEEKSIPISLRNTP